jgi:hypothetical protein
LNQDKKVGRRIGVPPRRTVLRTRGEGLPGGDT